MLFYFNPLITIILKINDLDIVKIFSVLIKVIKQEEPKDNK
jgi:hypothetical protein